MVSTEDRIKTFQKELDMIYDGTIKQFVKFCLMSAPDYFFTNCPASSSGKYHPLDELGHDGTILHTKKVCIVAYDLCRGLSCEKNRDEIIASCIIHDLLKQGKTMSGHTVKVHPNLAAELVSEVHNATQILSEESFNIIRGCVGYHYGPWSIQPWIKDLSQYTSCEMCVYLSDYIASKRTIEISLK